MFKNDGWTCSQLKNNKMSFLMFNTKSAKFMKKISSQKKKQKY